MCVSLTSVLFFITSVLIEIYLRCFTESVSLRDIGKPTSRAEICCPNSLYFKAAKGAHNGSALIHYKKTEKKQVRPQFWNKRSSFIENFQFQYLFPTFWLEF